MNLQKSSKKLLKYKRKLENVKAKIRPKIPLFIGIIILFFTIKILAGGVNWLKNQGLSLNYLNLLFKNNLQQLVRSYKGRTNILVLGSSGNGLSGNDLTDTMIFSSINLFSQDILLISLPRDIWSPTLQDKINSAYHYGEEKKQGGGLILAKSITEEILGQPVHYAVLIDFEGFKKLIDTVGGIEIEVKQEFTDEQFPIPGKENDECGGDPDYACRYEIIKFKKGLQTMDGESALKYVRSRNAQGSQGSDFARSARQQQVILAFKDKLLNPNIIFNPFKLRQIQKELPKTILSDMRLSESLAVIKAFFGSEKNSLRKVILDDGNIEEDRAGWLYSPPISRFGRWVLMPRKDSFNIIHDLISCHLELFNCDIQPEDY